MSVYRRKDRKSKPWIFEWSIIDDSGKPRTRRKSFATQKEAKHAEAKHIVETGGEVPMNPEITFVDYFDQWLKTYKAKSVSENTMTKYATSRNIIKQYFAETMIKDITRTKYQRFINWYIDDSWGHKHSKQSVEKLHSHAHQCLLSAVDDNYLLKDPAIRAELGGEDGKSEEEKFLQADDFEKLRDYANRFTDPSRIGLALVQFAIYTGCRISEIEALTWHDVDEEANTVNIVKSFNYHTWYPEHDKETGKVIWPDREKLFLPVKNHENRKLDVSPVLIKSLHRLILAAKIRGKDNPYDLIFVGPDCTPPTDNDANKEMRRAMKRIDIYNTNKTFTFHGLRHSHGSYLLSQGVKIEYVSRRLGHKNLAITLKVYTHILERLKTEEASKAVKVL